MARKRTPREAPLGPSITIKTQKFGWCNDSHHENCRPEFTYFEKTYQCSCECHEPSTEKKGKKK